MQQNGKVAEFQDKYGDTKVIHKTRHGLKVKRDRLTPIIQMNQAVSGLVGERVRKLREQQGLTLEQLAYRIGIRSGHPKERMWAIENATRGEGIRFGTLYALALALDVNVCDLLPTADDVAAEARVTTAPETSVALGNGVWG